MLLLKEDGIQILSLLVVLRLEEEVHVLDFLWPRVSALLVEGQVIVGQAPLQVPDALDQLIIALLVFGVQVVLILDVVDLRFELLELVLDLRKLGAEVQHVVRFVVDLPPRTGLPGRHSHHTLLRNRALRDLPRTLR